MPINIVHFDVSPSPGVNVADTWEGVSGKVGAAQAREILTAVVADKVVTDEELSSARFLVRTLEDGPQKDLAVDLYGQICTARNNHRLLEDIFKQRPELKTRWDELHAAVEWRRDPVASAKSEAMEAIVEDHDVAELKVMLSFLHGQLGSNGLRDFFVSQVKGLPKADVVRLFKDWPTQSWGELPGHATLSAWANEPT